MFRSSQIQNCIIVFSSSIKRNDNAKAQLTVNLVDDKLKYLQTDTIDNSNIDLSHLGRKGLHMTPHGTGKLAVNIIKNVYCNPLEWHLHIAMKPQLTYMTSARQNMVTMIALLYTTSTFPN